MNKIAKSLALLGLTLITGATISTFNTTEADASTLKSLPTSLRGNWYAYNKHYKKYQFLNFSKTKFKTDFGNTPNTYLWHMNSQAFTTKFHLSKAFSLGKLVNRTKFVALKEPKGWTGISGQQIAVSYKVTNMKLAGKKQKVLLEYIAIPGSNNVNKVLAYT